MTKIATLLLAVTLIAPSAGWADTTSNAPQTPAANLKPVTLSITGDSVPMPKVLDSLAAQTSSTILYDDTVKGSMGESQIKLPTLDAMFKFLEVKESGLTVQSVYVPADKPVPSAIRLVALVNELKQIQESGLVLVGNDNNSTITFSRGNAPQTAPPGMKLVYLATNETTRAQMAAAKAAQLQAAAATPAQAQALTQNQPGLAGFQLPSNAGMNPPSMTPATVDSQAAARKAYHEQVRAARAAARAQRLQQQQSAGNANAAQASNESRL